MLFRLVLFLVLLSSLGFGKLKNVDKAYLSDVNLLTNPGFESGLARWNITGSSTLNLESSNPLTGSRSAKWDASAASEYLYSQSKTVTTGLKGNQCVVLINYLWESGTSGQITLAVNDGSDDIITPIDLEQTFGVMREAFIIFTCPTSGTMRIKLASTANAAEITIDGAHLGTTKEISISDSLAAGTIMSFGGSSSPDGWLTCDGSAIARTGIYAGLFDAIGTTWGVGNGSTTFNVPDLRGVYLRGTGTHGSLLMADGDPFAGPSLGASENDQIQGHYHGFGGVGSLFNQTNAAAPPMNSVTADAQGGSNAASATLKAHKYVTAPTTDGAHGAPRTGDETKPVSYGVNYIIKYTRATTTKAITVDESNKMSSILYAGHADNTNSVTAGSWTTFNDADWSNDRTLIGKAAIPTVTNDLGLSVVGGLEKGTYLAIANGMFYVGDNGAGTDCSFGIFDGTTRRGATRVFNGSGADLESIGTIVGVFNYTARQPTANFVMQGYRTSGAGTCTIAFEQAKNNFEISIIPIGKNLSNLLQLDNMVTSTYSAGTKVVSAYITNSGTPTVSDQDGNWISSITDTGAGDMLINITAGTFSVAPRCNMTMESHPAYNDNGMGIWHREPATTTQLDINSSIGSGVLADTNFYIICVGK